MIILGCSIAIAVLVILLLSITRFSRSPTWRATVAPLASIIGSGFLVSGPLLAKEFGGLALPAMALLLLLAYLVGAVIRFNIRYLEPVLASVGFNDSVAWVARIGQGMLAIAYAVSVAYYLRLLAEFVLKDVQNHHGLIARALVTLMIVVFVALSFGKGLRRVEHLAHGTVSLKIGVVAGLLAALGLHWVWHHGEPIVLPQAPLSLHSATVLLGLLITVQGFEISRYLGQTYLPELRIKTMQHAQWISAGIYLAFILLLTPFLGQAAQSQGVAGILDVMQLVGPGLAVMVLIGAAFSQVSAAVADSIGSSGLLCEVSRDRLSLKQAFVLAGALAIAVVWFTNPYEIIALASRAFALFYALQCVLAVMVSVRTGAGGFFRRAGIALIGLVCLIAMLAGAPAE
jgi:hypothetical protein